jgi:hypothetical protein
VPFCVKHYRVLDAQGDVLFEENNNHQTRNTVTLDVATITTELHIEVLASHGNAPAALFEVRCYAA